jgi:CRISPR/Cas system-associated exonuclease Cas4 (RecB family)
MNERWIKASEIGEYLYCQRSWWYRLQGAESANVRELAIGSELHARHGGALRWSTWQRGLAYLLIAAAVGILLLGTFQ